MEVTNDIVLVKKARKQCIRELPTIILFAALIVYLFLGAAIFSGIEAGNEANENRKISDAKANYSQNLQEVVNFLVSNSIGVTEQEITDMINNITAAAVESSLDETENWNYGGALFFVLTVCTTIGYGKTAPQTTNGQVAFVFFALIGIPIALAFFKYFGKMLKRFTDWVTGKIITKKEYTKEAWAVVEIIAFSIAGFVFLILIPAGIFQTIQSWTYFESFYYCLVTLTTVGFGDFVPGISSNTSLNNFYRVCAGCWILIGLAYLFLVIEQLQDIVETFAKRMGKKDDQ